MRAARNSASRPPAIRQCARAGVICGWRGRRRGLHQHSGERLRQYGFHGDSRTWSSRSTAAPPSPFPTSICRAEMPVFPDSRSGGRPSKNTQRRVCRQSGPAGGRPGGHVRRHHSHHRLQQQHLFPREPRQQRRARGHRLWHQRCGIHCGLDRDNGNSATPSIPAAGPPSRALSFAGLTYGTDGQTITISAADATGDSANATITLGNDSPGREGRSIDETIGAINAQLQRSGSDPATDRGRQGERGRRGAHWFSEHTAFVPGNRG